MLRTHCWRWLAAWYDPEPTRRLGFPVFIVARFPELHLCLEAANCTFPVVFHFGPLILRPHLLARIPSHFDTFLSLFDMWNPWFLVLYYECHLAIVLLVSSFLIDDVLGWPA
jgi:hypothetical protein